jgi:hypothetical protein
MASAMPRSSSTTIHGRREGEVSSLAIGDGMAAGAAGLAGASARSTG